MVVIRCKLELILLISTGVDCMKLTPPEWIEGEQGDLQCVNPFSVIIKHKDNSVTSCLTGNAPVCDPTVSYSTVDAVGDTVTFTIANVSKQRDDGVWTCNDLSITIDVNVPVPDAEITNKNNLIFTDKQNTPVTCQTGVSHSHASITWSIGGKNVQGGTATNNTDGTTTSILQYTADTADHNKTLQCSATNGYGATKNDSMILNIRCAPQEGSVDCRIMDTKVQLVADVIAYPAPSFTWYYTNTTTGVLIPIPNDSSYQQADKNTPSNTFRSTLDITISQNLDDRSYTVNVTNDVGSKELHIREASLKCQDDGSKLLSSGLLVAVCVFVVSFQRCLY